MTQLKLLTPFTINKGKTEYIFEVSVKQHFIKKIYHQNITNKYVKLD